VNDFSSLDAALADSKDCKIEKGEDPRKVLGCLKTFADFHVKLVTLADNSHTLKLYGAILGSVWRYQFMYFSKRGARPLFEAHYQIVESIKSGDFDQAKKVLMEHMSYNYEQIINSEGVNMPAYTQAQTSGIHFQGRI